jgi:hypothetical protein
MSRPTIDYLNARKACKAASGGKTYSRETEYCPDSQLDIWEQTERKIESAFADLNLKTEVFFQVLFDRLGMSQDGLELEATF